jgi:PilZ domain
MSCVVQFTPPGAALAARSDTDGRSAQRRRVLKAGIAASNDRHLTVACTVRDLSATGARLRVEGSLTVPNTFELIIDVDGLEANCEVVWRKANEVGVKFLSAPRIVAAKRVQIINPLTPSKPPSLRRKPSP